MSIQFGVYGAYNQQFRDHMAPLENKNMGWLKNWAVCSSIHNISWIVSPIYKIGKLFWLVHTQSKLFSLKHRMNSTINCSHEDFATRWRAIHA